MSNSQGEVIREGGKFWAIVNDEFVEVSNPNPRSYEVKAYGITFIEGKVYGNYHGKYVVICIKDDGTMDVKYIEVRIGAVVSLNETVNYPMLAQAETIFKQREREKTEVFRLKAHEFRGDNAMMTLGYIAACGSIEVSVPEKFVKLFGEKHKALTGQPLEEHVGSGYSVTKCEGRWGISTKVHLPPQAAQIAAKLALPEPIVDDEGVQVCNNAFTYGLLRMGFRMGRNAERIAELAAKFGDGAEAFMAGAALAA